MEDTIKHLMNRINFLEALLELNAGTLEKAMETNRMLIEEMSKRVK